MASWDGGSLAMALHASDDAVWRAVRREGIQWQRHRSWCVSTAPEFAAKAADVIALYLNPPQNAWVLSVDEKPSIQALERARGYVQTSSGKIVQGLKSPYQRAWHGQPVRRLGGRYRRHPRQDDADQAARRLSVLHGRGRGGPTR